MPHPPLLLPENVAKGARNAALLFTLLGAAYRVRSQGGGSDNPAGYAQVLSGENAEALKNVMIKVGLAGGFLKARRHRVDAAQCVLPQRRRRHRERPARRRRLQRRPGGQLAGSGRTGGGRRCPRLGVTSMLFPRTRHRRRGDVITARIRTRPCGRAMMMAITTRSCMGLVKRKASCRRWKERAVVAK